MPDIEDPRWNAPLKLLCATKSRTRFVTLLDAVETAWFREPDLTLGQLVCKLADGKPEELDDYALYLRAHRERKDIPCALVASDTA